MIFKQVDATHLERYESIPMLVHVESILAPRKIENGLGGIVFEEKKVEPYIKDYNIYEPPTGFPKEFDIANWAFFMAFDGEIPVGGATLASRTPEIHMLGGRDDLAMLWDLRVDTRYRRRGVASRLFDMAVEWAREQGLRQLNIESQNINVPACRFYAKKGASICTIDEHAYADDTDCRDEIMLIWCLDLF